MELIVNGRTIKRMVGFWQQLDMKQGTLMGRRINQEVVKD